MATGTPNPKIEELRSRLKADPRSRLFFPLAEELRKQGNLEEAERVLRDGLAHHASYVSALISLGRVLHELGRHEEAATTLSRALELDPGNVVAARLLADAHLASGDRIAALKKYKLASALLPADEELTETIERLGRELADTPQPSDDGAILAPESVEPPDAAEELTLEGDSLQVPFAAVPETPLLTVATGEDEIVEAVDPAGQQLSVVSSEELFNTDPEQTESAGIWLASHEQTAGGGEVVEGPWHDQEPATSEVEAVTDAEPAGTAAGVMSDADEEVETPAAAATSSPIETLTMGDLYAQQGHADAAREIYARILERHPENAEVRSKLEQLTGEGSFSRRERVITKLESWLASMTRETGRV